MYFLSIFYLILLNPMQLTSQFSFDCIILVLHLQYVFIQWHSILEELVQLAILLLLVYFLIFEQFQFIFQILDFILKSLNVLFFYCVVLLYLFGFMHLTLFLRVVISFILPLSFHSIQFLLHLAQLVTLLSFAIMQPFYVFVQLRSVHELRLNH
jgi:hypothetical protein